MLALAAVGLALSFTAAPDRVGPIAWDAVRARDHGRVLDIAVADVPCRLPPRYARLREATRSVTVTLYSPKPSGFCIQILQRACVTIRLPHALGRRRVRDGTPRHGARDPGRRPFRSCRRIPVRRG